MLLDFPCAVSTLMHCDLCCKTVLVEHCLEVFRDSYARVVIGPWDVNFVPHMPHVRCTISCMINVLRVVLVTSCRTILIFLFADEMCCLHAECSVQTVSGSA